MAKVDNERERTFGGHLISTATLFMFLYCLYQTLKGMALIVQAYGDYLSPFSQHGWIHMTPEGSIVFDGLLTAQNSAMGSEGVTMIVGAGILMVITILIATLLPIKIFKD